MAAGIAPLAGKVPPLPLIKSFFETARIGGINKPVKVAFRGNVEFVDANVEAIVIDREMREVGDTRPALVGIVRQRGIEDVNEIVTGWIRSLADGEI
jgi:hypothetical protein